MYIYTLKDPFTNEIRYIGKTINLKKRFSNHCNIKSKLKSKSHLSNWLLSILKNNKKPIMEILDITDGNNIDLSNLEIYWIAQFRAWGFRLVNLTIGGEGISGYKQTIETIQKRTNSYKNIPLTEEHKQKIGNANRNKKMSDDSKKKMSISRKGKPAKNKLKIIQYDKSMKIIDEFNSIYEAASKNNILRTSIVNNLKNRSKTSGGFIWKYKKN